eukprot:COSAG01_NODE_7327_length_3250_cov_3.910505_4_plen_103_part_00
MYFYAMRAWLARAAAAAAAGARAAARLRTIEPAAPAQRPPVGRTAVHKHLYRLTRPENQPTQRRLRPAVTLHLYSRNQQQPAGRCRSSCTCGPGTQVEIHLG